MLSSAATQDRSLGIDAMRVLGMLAILAGHVWWNDTARALLYTWHVPLFFVLSGYLWVPGRPFRQELKSRTFTLLVPYFLWFFLLAALTWAPQLRDGSFSVGRAAGSVYGGTSLTAPFSAFWFVTALFFACLAYRMIDGFPIWAKWIVAAVALLVTAYAPHQPATLIPLGAGLGIAALIFLVAGQTLRLLLDRMSARNQVLVGILAVSLGALLVASGAAPLDLKYLDLGSPVLSVTAAILLSCGAVALSIRLLDRVPRVIAAGITLAAQASLVVLFVHIPLLMLAGGAGSMTLSSFVWAVVSSWTIGIMLLHVSRSWPLTGIRSRNGLAQPRLVQDADR
jgi:acyltransferase